MSETVQNSHSDALSGSGASGQALGNADTTTTAIPVSSSNPFLKSSSSNRGEHQSPPLATPEHPLPNPFSPDPHVQRDPQPDQAEDIPQLPPRPDYPYYQDAPADNMATAATANPTPPTIPNAEPARNEEPEVADTPEIANLKAMFPDFDSAVL